jgi:hypothetical protein
VRVFPDTSGAHDGFSIETETECLHAYQLNTAGGHEHENNPALLLEYSLPTMNSVEQKEFSDMTGLLWNKVLENVDSQAGEGYLGLLDSMPKYDYQAPESRNMVFCPLTPAGGRQHGPSLYPGNLTPPASSLSTINAANLFDKSPTAKVGDDINSVNTTQSSKARVCRRERAKIRQARYHGNINDSIGRLRDLVTNNSHSGDLPYTQYNHGGVPCTKASVLSAATTQMEFYDKSHQTLRVAREELEKQMETLEEQTHRTFHY